MNLSKLANKIYFNQNPEGERLIKYKEAHPGFEFDYEDKFKSNEEDDFVYILKGMKFDYKKIPIFYFTNVNSMSLTMKCGFPFRKFI